MKKHLKSIAGAAAIAFAIPSSAATLIIDGNGQLTGAQGVDVQGTLYDVAFVDGTCAAVFNGCDSVSDFQFQSTLAVTAGQSLLAQVFLDGNAGQFDTNPALTSGCENIGFCTVLTPFFVQNTALDTSWTQNFSSENGDVSRQVQIPQTVTTTNSSGFVWARFSLASSPVPEPGTWLMMILGLGAIGGMMRGRSGGARKEKFPLRVRYL